MTALPMQKDALRFARAALFGAVACDCHQPTTPPHPTDIAEARRHAILAAQDALQRAAANAEAKATLMGRMYIAPHKACRPFVRIVSKRVNRRSAAVIGMLIGVAITAAALRISGGAR